MDLIQQIFDKKFSGVAATRLRSEALATWDKSAIMQNQQLAEELYKPITGKLKNKKYI